MSNHEHEQQIRMNRRRRLRSMTFSCPGCGTDVTPSNAGGYRFFCDRCVGAFPVFPKDGGGYLIEGQYPNFSWKRVSD